MNSEPFPEFRVLSESVAFAGRMFAVVHRKVFLEGSVRTWEVLRSRDVVRVIPLDEQDRVTLIEEFRPELGRKQLRLVSGGVELGHTPVDAAVAELREELGLESARLEPLGSTRILNKLEAGVHASAAHPPLRVVGPAETHVEPVQVTLEEAFRIAVWDRDFDETARIWLIRLALDRGVRWPDA